MNSPERRRKVDDLGRIVLPADLRKLFGIKPGDEVGVSVDGGSLVVTKIDQRCALCGSEHNLSPYKDKQVCDDCRTELTPLDLR